jgi:hypothetical protein
VYFVNFFFPPFGLWSAFKYLVQDGAGAKAVGGIATLLTIIALVFLTYETLKMIEILNQLAPLLMNSNQMGG